MQAKSVQQIENSRTPAPQLVQQVQSMPPQPINSPRPSEIPANFGQTTFLDDEESDRTIILGAEMANDVNSRPMLVRKKNNEQIILRKDLFTIGKEAKYVDGKMIPCNQEIPITNGMNIRLSNEEFEFRLY